MEFQRLFEDVMAKVGGQFMRVKPHGKLGDKKCDGLFYGDDVVYQVYSPDEVTLTKTLTKINEDLAGAIAEWPNLREWVFVYNTRAGVAADVPALLKTKQKERKYRKLTITPLSNDGLWDLVRALPAQQKAELLGAPPGYEGFANPEALSSEIRERMKHGRFVVVQDTMSPINMANAIEAMKPALPLGPPLFLRREPKDVAWELAADHQRHLVEEAIARSRDQLPRFAVFSLTPIPLGIHLGYLLSDRVEVLPYQYHRDRMTWAWKETITDPDVSFSTTGMPDSVDPRICEAIIRLSLSEDVLPAQTDAIIANADVALDIRVAAPSRSWLVHPAQIVAFRQTFREAVATLCKRRPGCTRIHLFAAVPMACAVAAGQAINPRMTPPVDLYQFDWQASPQYSHALSLSAK